MAKRKLTRQQKWRVEKIQAERAERAQRKEKEISSRLNNNELGPEQEGRVMAHFGVQVEVEAIEPPHSIVRCHLRANLGSLVTGDKVIFRVPVDEAGNEQENAEGVVGAVLPRQSELSRPNMHGDIKPVAANIDYIVLVVACEPEAYANLIDRYLVAAENCNITPIILLNKIDLLDEVSRKKMENLLSPYQELGYKVMELSAVQEDSLNEFKQWLVDKTCVFVGQSGVGKSSLIQTLLPEQELRVGSLSHAKKKGKHTTTTARLYHFPAGGDLIDSPGIREFGLWHMDEDQVLYGFTEIRQFEGMCKFRDCKHQQEPGCAILKALEDGQISQERFESYQRILNTLTEL